MRDPRRRAMGLIPTTDAVAAGKADTGTRDVMFNARSRGRASTAMSSVISPGNNPRKCVKPAGALHRPRRNISRAECPDCEPISPFRIDCKILF